MNLVKALGGGVNEVRTFSAWLDKNLFEGATFADFRKTPGPRVWINASDIYNRTPFIYGEAAFIALCSDLAAYPIAEAHSRRGEFDAAFEWLERAYAQRDGGLVGVKMSPLLRSLHGDSRWGAFLKRMRLED